MPDGIIRDPKMNPKEKNYGIIHSEGDKKHFYYSKNENDWTRFCLPGEVVTFEKISGETYDTEINYEEKGIMYEGIRIYGQVIITEYNDNSNISPVYRRIMRPLPENARRQAIRNAMRNPRPGESQLESDFGSAP